MPWEVIEKVLADAASRHSSFILSGGEPLLYSRFRDLSIALHEAGRVAITCTNGMLLDRYLDVSSGQSLPDLSGIARWARATE